MDLREKVILGSVWPGLPGKTIRVRVEESIDNRELRTVIEESGFVDGVRTWTEMDVWHDVTDGVSILFGVVDGVPPLVNVASAPPEIVAMRIAIEQAIDFLGRPVWDDRKDKLRAGGGGS